MQAFIADVSVVVIAAGCAAATTETTANRPALLPAGCLSDQADA